MPLSRRTGEELRESGSRCSNWRLHLAAVVAPVAAKVGSRLIAEVQQRLLCGISAPCLNRPGAVQFDVVSFKAPKESCDSSKNLQGAANSDPELD